MTKIINFSNSYDYNDFIIIHDNDEDSKTNGVMSNNSISESSFDATTFERFLSNGDDFTKCIDPLKIQPNHKDIRNSLSSRSSTRDDDESNLSDKIPQIQQNDLENMINTMGTQNLTSRQKTNIQENDEEDNDDDNDDDDDMNNDEDDDNDDDDDYDVDSDDLEDDEEKPVKRILRKRSSNIPRISQNDGFHRKRNNSCSDKKMKNCKHVWQFLRDELKNESQNVEWIEKKKGIFKIKHQKNIAKLWGNYKERKSRLAMDYEKMSRGIRHSRKDGFFKFIEKNKSYGVKLVYQFGDKAVLNCSWLSSFVKSE